MHHKTPLISVVTPANDINPNFDTYIDGWLKQSESLDLFEVTIVTTNRTQFEAVEKSLHRYTDPSNKDLNIRVFLLEEIGTSRAKAMNHAIRASHGSIICLFGDDFIPKVNTIREHIAFHHAHKEINDVGIGMAFLPHEFKNEFTEWLEVSGSLFGIPFTRDATFIPPDFFYIGNTSIKKDFLQKSGLFDDDFKYHSTEDWELGIRLKKLGLKSKLIVKADVTHQHEVTLEGRLISVREQGASAKLYDGKNQASQSPWHKYVRKPYLFLQLKMHLFRLIHKVTQSKKMLHKQFKYQIKMAFYEGYHSGNNLPTHSHQY